MFRTLKVFCIGKFAQDLDVSKKLSKCWFREAAYFESVMWSPDNSILYMQIAYKVCCIVRLYYFQVFCMIVFADFSRWWILLHVYIGYNTYIDIYKKLYATKQYFSIVYISTFQLWGCGGSMLWGCGGSINGDVVAQ